MIIRNPFTAHIHSVFSIFLALLLCACTTFPSTASPWDRTYRGDFDSRVRFLVLHYTAANFADSMRLLTGKVSVHYVVADPTDETYINLGRSGPNIFNLVDEKDRAWHAGLSFWKDRTNINDSSIGIEIVNVPTEENGVITFPPFDEDQIEAVKYLAQDILARYPTIQAPYVLAHSDIAPHRKMDPGPAFPWYKLYLSGIGAWYDEATKQKYIAQYSQEGIPEHSAIVSLFSRYGYDIRLADQEDKFKQLVRAFQMHFRQHTYDGILDIETAAILAALVEKYYPHAQ